MRYDILSIYCLLDDFCKTYEEWEKARLIDTGRSQHREGLLSLSEMLTIMVCFHLDAFKNFKYYYLYGVCVKNKKCFKELPCYGRFVAWIPRLFVPLMVILHSLSEKETGIYFADAMKLAICHNKRISQNRVFKHVAKVQWGGSMDLNYI